MIQNRGAWEDWVGHFSWHGFCCNWINPKPQFPHLCEKNIYFILQTSADNSKCSYSSSLIVTLMHYQHSWCNLWRLLSKHLCWDVTLTNRTSLSHSTVSLIHESIPGHCQKSHLLLVSYCWLSICIKCWFYDSRHINRCRNFLALWKHNENPQLSNILRISYFDSLKWTMNWLVNDHDLSDGFCQHLITTTWQIRLSIIITMFTLCTVSNVYPLSFYCLYGNKGHHSIYFLIERHYWVNAYIFLLSHNEILFLH